MIVVRLRAWRMGVRSLRLHPLRSLLTILGILVGVASVIWLLAIGQGISASVQRQIEGSGADNIIVRSIKPRLTPTTASAARGVVNYGLTRRDFERLQETVPTIDRALPVRELRREFRRGSHLVDGRLVGCTPEYATVTHLDPDRGRFLSDADVEFKRNVCVLAASVAERLFPIEDPLGPLDPRREPVLRRDRDRQGLARLGRHRRLADGAGLLERRLHSAQRRLGPHRRHRGHAAERLV